MKICPFDLLTDDKTGKLSQAKLWLNVCYITLTYIMLRVVDSTTLDLGGVALLMLVYGALVGGNHLAIYFIKKKYGADITLPGHKAKK
jgi:hypothetical protein